MQTNFKPKQLKDPRIAEVDKILRKCVHCGFCTATCPTYVLLGDERDSPRGRIYLIKEMFERGRKASPQVQHHVDRCLSCLSCLALRGARLVRPLAGVFKRLGLPQLAAMMELAPNSLLMPTASYAGPGTAATKGERRKRVILLAGCAQQVLRPEINDATIRLLARRGVDVEVAPGAGCCGALVHHMGREAAAIAMAKRNVDAWTRLMDKGEAVDAVIVNTSGCGTTVKDYGHMLKRESKYAERAAKLAAITRDVTEFLGTYDMGPPKRWSSLRIAYHSACSMQHGQRIIDEPRKLLRNAGFTVMEIPEGHICCGSAGTYNILQPAIAGELRARKVANIRSVRPDVVATGNIGCISQLAIGMDIPIAHTVELLDWAYGGPVPRGLEGLSRHVKDVPEPKPLVVIT
jgi:glycolate oxidase iron-sulfur subunit